MLHSPGIIFRAIYTQVHVSNDELIEDICIKHLSLKSPGSPSKKSRSVTRHPGQICPLASVHHGL